MAEPNSKEVPKDTQEDPYPETYGIPPDFLQMLVCPLGKAELRLENGYLICTRCGPAFKIEDGIPILLMEEAKLPEGVDRIEDLPCCKEEKDGNHDSQASGASA